MKTSPKVTKLTCRVALQWKLWTVTPLRGFCCEFLTGLLRSRLIEEGELKIKISLKAIMRVFVFLLCYHPATKNTALHSVNLVPWYIVLYATYLSFQCKVILKMIFSSGVWSRSWCMYVPLLFKWKRCGKLLHLEQKYLFYFKSKILNRCSIFFSTKSQSTESFHLHCICCHSDLMCYKSLYLQENIRPRIYCKS